MGVVKTSTSKTGLTSFRQRVFPRARKVKPLRDKLVLYMKAKEEKTRGGVIIPQDAQRHPLEGIVLEVGPEVPQDGASPIKEGDVVVVSQYAGTEIVLEDEHGEEQTVLVVNYHDIQCRIEPVE